VDLPGLLVAALRLNLARQQGIDGREGMLYTQAMQRTADWAMALSDDEWRQWEELQARHQELRQQVDQLTKEAVRARKRKNRLFQRGRLRALRRKDRIGKGVVEADRST
jgi:hypothetical protein